MKRDTEDGASPDDPSPGSIDQDALDWFVRLQGAAGDPESVRAFRAWCESDPNHAAAFAKVAAVWGEPEFLLATKHVAEATGVKPPRAKRRRGSLAKKVGGSAAVVLLALVVAKLPQILVRLRADYVTATGEQRAIRLPDGSTLMLNTASAVALDFADGRRVVRLLEGEAYFDVRPDADHPFEVTAQYGRVTVKGTAFSVGRDGDADTVVLGRGLVDVARLARLSDHADLHPGEAVSVTASMLLPVRRIDTATALAWVDGRISFVDRPLSQVIDDLRRYYPGRIFVANGTVGQVSVSGNYKLDRPEVAIRSLAEAAGATVTTLPGGILVVR